MQSVVATARSGRLIQKGECHMTLIHRVFVVGALALASSAPAMAQSFDAEIDCGGVFAPGESVPFKVRLEEQAFQVHTIDLMVELDPQGAGTKVILHKTITLGSNQDLTIKRQLNLKLNAPAGDWDMRVIADDGALVMTDTCSFNVN
jgi:hypothetical protein